MAQTRRGSRGFKRTSALLQPSIRRVSETRGFAQSRLLTHWPEIAGEAVAAIARPVEVSYARQGMGATLTLLTTGAQAPVLEMQKEALRARKSGNCSAVAAVCAVPPDREAICRMSTGSARGDWYSRRSGATEKDPVSVPNLAPPRWARAV